MAHVIESQCLLCLPMAHKSWPAHLYIGPIPLELGAWAGVSASEQHKFSLPPLRESWSSSGPRMCSASVYV